jgi:polyhydroxybutyrate depolymerase
MRLGWLALALAAGGCASGAPLATLPIDEPGSRRGTIEHGGMSRSFVLHLPPKMPAPRSLLVALHGGGSSGESLEEVTGLSRIADREGLAVVYPDGLGGPHGFGRAWNAGRCCGIPHFFGVDDGAFIRALAGALRDRLEVERVFVVGYSNGGLLALALAGKMRLAGLGVYAATLPGSGPIIGPVVDAEPPEQPLSVLLIHSLSDPRVPYAGRERLEATDASFRHTGQFFAAAARCPAQAERSSAHGGAVIVDHFRGCAEGTQVKQLTLRNWNHEWPGPANLHRCKEPGEPLRELDAAEEMVRFFLESG